MLTSSSFVAVTVALFTGPLCLILFLAFRPRSNDLAGSAYIIHGSTTHARFLPAQSKHSFTYTTLSLLVSLRALEARQLNLGWRSLVFAYAPKFFALVGLSPDSYLQDDTTSRGLSMMEKIHRLLEERNMWSVNDRLGDVWTMTMPSFFGFAGTNPLTVHFCYDKQESGLILVILEVKDRT